MIALQRRHNGRDGVSNHQHHDCLLNRLFRSRSKKTSKLRITGLCAGNSPVTGELPTLMASNAENVSIWWRHHVIQKNSRLRPWNAVIHTTCINPWLSRSLSSIYLPMPWLLTAQCTALGLMTSWIWFNGIGWGTVMACCLTAPSHYLNQCLPYHQRAFVAITWGQLYKKCTKFLSLISVRKILI